jgi:UDP-N-acetyl-D-mannosaminuronic acid dehydrogenase
VHRSPQLARLIRTAREVNDHKPEWVLERVRAKAAKFRNPVIACLGIAFKADVDDLRESPAMDIVRQLQAERIGELLICEPNLREHPDFGLVSMNDAVKEADIVLLLVDHKSFRKLSAAQLKEKIVIDTRGIIR